MVSIMTPTTSAAAKASFRVTITLRSREVETCLELGNGSLKAGARRAIAIAAGERFSVNEISAVRELLELGDVAVAQLGRASPAGGVA